MSRARDTADQINRVNSSAADATAITVDSSENVGVGLTPSSWWSGMKAVETQASSGGVFASASVNGHFLTNAYYDGSNWKHKNNGAAEYYSQTGGIHQFLNVSSGSAGNNITWSERVRIDSDGLKFNGDTAAANALDEYEEGLWSPGLKGASSSNVATLTSATKGSYVKIGNQVTVNFIVVVSSIGSASGTVQITGLPFTVAAPLTTTGIQGNGTAGYFQGFATAVNNIVYTAEGNTNLLYVYGTTNGTQQSISGIQINQMGTGAVRGTITYRST